MSEDLAVCVIAALDQCSAMFELQEIIELCLEQFDEPVEKTQARVPLLLKMYLSALSYHFDELQTELARIRQHIVTSSSLNEE